MREEGAVYDAGETLLVRVTLSAEERQTLQVRGVDIQAVAREGAEDAIRRAADESWRAANTDAIDAYNAWIEKHGTIAEQIGLI